MAPTGLVIVAFLSFCAAVSTAHQLRYGGEAYGVGGLVRPLISSNRLRVCNAFPYSAALDMYRSSDKITADTPLRYKTCRDFHAALDVGDKLDFSFGDANVGTFSVSYLPSNDALLLLVVHLHDPVSTAVSFDSHVFARTDHAQVVTIDTYEGVIKATPRIQDDGTTNTSRVEDLRYNTVVAVNPGKYEVVLVSPGGLQDAKRPLVALSGESYVVMRTGVEAQHGGESYPEEVVVFPESDPTLLHSRAYCRNTDFVIALTVIISSLHRLC